MELLIARSLLDRIHAHMATDPGREVCGLLFGGEGRIEAAMPAANVHPDPARHFELDPAALIAARRDQRNGGPRLIGHYHSHPSGDVMPSLRDADAAEPGSWWLILAPGKTGLFRAVAGGPIAGAFQAAELRVTP